MSKLVRSNATASPAHSGKVPKRKPDPEPESDSGESEKVIPSSLPEDENNQSNSEEEYKTPNKNAARKRIQIPDSPRKKSRREESEEEFIDEFPNEEQVEPTQAMEMEDEAPPLSVIRNLNNELDEADDHAQQSPKEPVIELPLLEQFLKDPKDSSIRKKMFRYISSDMDEFKSLSIDQLESLTEVLEPDSMEIATVFKLIKNYNNRAIEKTNPIKNNSVQAPVAQVAQIPRSEISSNVMNNIPLVKCNDMKVNPTMEKLDRALGNNLCHENCGELVCSSQQRKNKRVDFFTHHGVRRNEKLDKDVEFCQQWMQEKLPNFTLQTPFCVNSFWSYGAMGNASELNESYADNKDREGARPKNLGECTRGFRISNEASCVEDRDMDEYNARVLDKNGNIDPIILSKQGHMSYTSKSMNSFIEKCENLAAQIKLTILKPDESKPEELKFGEVYRNLANEMVIKSEEQRIEKLKEMERTEKHKAAQLAKNAKSSTNNKKKDQPEEVKEKKILTEEELEEIKLKEEAKREAERETALYSFFDNANIFKKHKLFIYNGVKEAYVSNNIFKAIFRERGSTDKPSKDELIFKEYVSGKLKMSIPEMHNWAVNPANKKETTGKWDIIGFLEVPTKMCRMATSNERRQNPAKPYIQMSQEQIEFIYRKNYGKSIYGSSILTLNVAQNSKTKKLALNFELLDIIFGAPHASTYSIPISGEVDADAELLAEMANEYEDDEQSTLKVEEIVINTEVDYYNMKTKKNKGEDSYALPSTGGPIEDKIVEAIDTAGTENGLSVNNLMKMIKNEVKDLTLSTISTAVDSLVEKGIIYESVEGCYKTTVSAQKQQS